MGYDMSKLEGYATYSNKKEDNKASKIDSIVSAQKNEKKMKNDYLTRGNNGKMIDKGIACRLGIIDRDEVKIESEGDLISFNYGMYYPDEATLQLDTMIRYGFIPDRIKKELVIKLKEKNPSMIEEDFNKLFNDKTYVENMINIFLISAGYMDANDMLIDFESLPELLKNNECYLKGYNKVKKKGGR